MRVHFFNRGKTRADFKCKGKEPSESDTVSVIDVFGVIRMSMQSFTKLVGIGSKSDDLHGVNRTRRLTSSAAAQVTLYKTFKDDSVQTSVSQRARKSE